MNDDFWAEVTPCSEMEEEPDEWMGIMRLCVRTRSLLSELYPSIEIRYLGFSRGFDAMSVMGVESIVDKRDFRRLWVVVGDLPPAIFDASLHSADAVFEKYALSLKKWVVDSSYNIAHDIGLPVCFQDSIMEVPRTEEIVELVAARADFILNHLSTLNS